MPGLVPLPVPPEPETTVSDSDWEQLAAALVHCVLSAWRNMPNIDTTERADRDGKAA